MKYMIAVPFACLSAFLAFYGIAMLIRATDAYDSPWWVFAIVGSASLTLAAVVAAVA